MSLERALDAQGTSDRRRYGDGTLVGGRCDACGTTTWPRRAVCPRCGSGVVSEHELPTEGTLETWTQVWVQAGDIDPPYVLGLVRLGGVAIFCHVRGDIESIRVPCAVVMHVDPENHPAVYAEPALPVVRHA